MCRMPSSHSCMPVVNKSWQWEQKLSAQASTPLVSVVLSALLPVIAKAADLQHQDCRAQKPVLWAKCFVWLVFSEPISVQNSVFEDAALTAAAFWSLFLTFAALRQVLLHELARKSFLRGVDLQWKTKCDKKKSNLLTSHLLHLCKFKVLLTMICLSLETDIGPFLPPH